MQTLANNEDPDEMSYNIAFHQVWYLIVLIPDLCLPLYFILFAKKNDLKRKKYNLIWKV